MRSCLLHIIISILLPLASFSQKVIIIDVDGTINPVASDYIKRGIQKAEKDHAQCLVIRLNTPGGLLQSTRIIVSAILDAPVPVVVFVSPVGSHAGSAGVFITMSGHIAAMSPGTNIGAAHPVSVQQKMDPVMNEKVTNDAAAFIRTIAQHRNRDTVWADQAVRNSKSITSGEALEKNVIDIVARNMDDLLNKIDGRVIVTPAGSKTLQTKNALLETEEMTWVEKLLNVLVDPNVAYVLMLLGFYGLLFEIYSPGAIFPGVIGGICIILAFYAMHTLPVNYAGLALIIFSVILFLLEIKVVSYGILAIGGTISFLLGSLMLLRNESPLEFVRISKAVIFPAVAVTAGFFLFLITMGIRVQRNKSVIGAETIIGSIGTSQESFDKTGMVMVMGELWLAEITTGEIEKGQKIKVTGRNKFTLLVEPA